MKNFAFGLIVTVVLALGSVGTAAAGPTCSDVGLLGVATHGEHVIRDYVSTGTIAGGAPSHRGSVVQPGASFCVEQAQSPALP